MRPAALDDLVNEAEGLNNDDFNPVSWYDSFGTDGKKYCISWDVYCMSTYVNIDAHKIDVPTEIPSLDGLIEY
jgi:hypothetical protein